MGLQIRKYLAGNMLKKTGLRPAQAADSQSIYAMMKALAVEVGDESRFSARHADVVAAAFTEAPEYQVILAELDGQIVGLVTYFPIYSTYKGRDYLHVDNLYVTPAARQHGIARQLLDEVIKIAQQNSYFRIELRVRDDCPARSFYEAIGMQLNAEVLYRLDLEEK